MTVRYDKQTVKVLDDGGLSYDEIVGVLTGIDYNFDSFCYSMGRYATEYMGADVTVECIPHAGWVEFTSIRIM